MARIAGINIPTNKRVIIALTYIHGIGRTTALEIADKLGIDHARRVQDLSDDTFFFFLSTKLSFVSFITLRVDGFV